MFFVPLVAAIGGGVAIIIGAGPTDLVVRHSITAAALVLVCFSMIDNIRRIDWSDIRAGLPAFLSLTVMPLTFSITHGIGAAFISYVAVKVATGQPRKVHPLMWSVAGLFVLVFVLPVLD